MVDRLKIALAQTNPTMGDIQGNLARLRAARAEAAAKGADLVVASEMVITGYPTEDLVLKPMFLEAAHAAVEALAGETADGGPGMIVGGPSLKEPGARAPLFGKVLNSAYILDKGEILTLRSKYDLPNYGVFDAHNHKDCHSQHHQCSLLQLVRPDNSWCLPDSRIICPAMMAIKLFCCRSLC